MLCPGSVAMADGLPDTSSAYADEGTAAHFLASESLAMGEPADFHSGLVIEVRPDGAYWFTEDDSAPHPLFTADDDMVRHVQKYIDVVADLEGEDGELHVEQRLPIGHITGEADAHGTSDAVIIRGDELIVVDLKYGMGNRVDADNNRQLMLYALGALEEFGMVYDIHSVRLVISQPRLDHVSEWSMTIEDLLVFGEEAMGAAKTATLAHKFASNWRGNADAAYLVPGDAQCKWCKAKATCPALANFVQDSVGAGFEVLADAAENDPYLLAALVDLTTPDQLAVKMSAVAVVEDWCKSIRAKVETNLLMGVPVPGYKLVQGKKGNRAWRNAEEAEELLKKMRVQHDKMYDYKLISPTTAEKLAKADVIGPRQWPKVQELITQADGKPSVAPESDKRPALDIAPTADAFEDISADDLV